MNVAVIGSGGREHALSHKIKESALLDNLYVIPGNPGTASLGENIDLDINDHQALDNFCKENNIDLVVIGPEQVLEKGLADILRNNEIKVFGPSKEAAKIESSKSFAKSIMKIAGVPTAKYLKFTNAMYDHAKDYLKGKKYPCVIKADGLAAGKGVCVCNNAEEAEIAINDAFVSKVFGSAGDSVLIEEFLVGEETSVFAITDGKNFVTLPPSQDHKRVGDNDTGKNTGGMGAYAPTPFVNDELMEEIKTTIIAPTLKALNEQGKNFIGCLYAGLILTEDGPKVIEFNCRFGDPETQVVLPLLEGDFLKLLYSAADSNLDLNAVSYSKRTAVCVVAASGGYPDDY
ncbi:MAG: phosphoribosylamine--glycine ligase, partial [Ignavibacteria bacterium]|nr:phosphoribosylamine--glycine ligase [Ignavibacteria bacterium]